MKSPRTAVTRPITTRLSGLPARQIAALGALARLAAVAPARGLCLFAGPRP